jgi:excisionase family DNA binding protein
MILMSDLETLQQQMAAIQATLKSILARLPDQALYPQPLLTVAETAQFLKISKSGVYRLHDSGKILGHRPSGKDKGDLRFRMADLQAYISTDQEKRTRSGIRAFTKLSGIKQSRLQKRK